MKNNKVEVKAMIYRGLLTLAQLMTVKCYAQSTDVFTKDLSDLSKKTCIQLSSEFKLCSIGSIS
ncbi:hypothetical protein HPP92_006660 [Vanilla planifolia]|uniref:Uncharacterized protein n=1 Tax=Vanilla planifolia TaxID=51239 RepID=A0A835RPS7_VANPL|nr:hypothetical protein HPP92_006660 [Vanilla planifolia]